jgi:hypothetical protein
MAQEWWQVVLVSNIRKTGKQTIVPNINDVPLWWHSVDELLLIDVLSPLIIAIALLIN